MLEWLAMITMLIDHIGMFVLKDQEWMRIIGRIAMPIYAFGIAMGFHYSKNRTKYMQRLIGIAIVAQLPFTLLMPTFFFNIIFTFIFGLTALIWIERTQNLYSKGIIMLSSMLIAEIMPLEYGSYAIVLIFLYHYVKNYWLILLHLLVNFVYYFSDVISEVQLYSLMGTVLILLLKDIKKFKVNRFLYRIFYPLQFAIIYLFLQFVMP